MTATSLSRVPNAPKTPMHSFRVNDELWQAAKDAAEQLDTTVADELRGALVKMVKRANKAR